MPSRASCCVPECTNQKNLCKWGLFSSDDGQLVKQRLCGVDGRGGCKNTSGVCKGLSFHRLPAKEEQRREWIVKIRRKNTPLTPNTYVCGVHFDGGKRQDASSVPTRFVWSKPAKKRTSHVSQAAGILDEVDMEIDENISRRSSTDSDSSDAADEEEDPVSWEGNVQDYVKALKNRVRQLEAGYMSVCGDLMEERKKVVELKHELSAAREDVSRLKEELENHNFPMPG